MHRLVDRADVFIHNFRPGTPERLGIGFDELIARNPRLVYVYGSCFGTNGPWAHKAGFHSSPNAIAGAGIIEAGDGNPPINRTYADPASALATAASILVALHARERTGRGQYVETVMLTSMAYAVSEWGVSWDGKRDRVGDSGQHGFGPHQRLYELPDGWIYVECATDAQRARFDELFGPDPVAAMRGARVDDVLTTLRDAGIASVRADGIDHAAFMLGDPHSRAVGVAVETSQPGLPDYWRAGPAIRFSAAPTPLATSPALGTDTARVLAELGCTDDEIADLARQGVTSPVGHGLPG
jgi:crotonobetainyl-CoA:carnitine CoA-transferase CaiB-like acyl-CoA transferase